MSVGAMLQEAMARCDLPTKALAAETNYSIEAIYAALSEKRRIPQDAKRKLAETHPLMGWAICLQETGYKIFEFIKGDRHPQTMLHRVEKEDHEADTALEGMGWRLIDKEKPEDLTEDDRIALTLAAKEIADRIKTDFNMLIEWEDRYKLGLLDLLIDKEKDPQKRAAV